MRLRFPATLGLVTFALVAGAPSLADACSPLPPGLASTLPADGDTYPGNGVLLFHGYNISLDRVTVTVDGSPAALVAVDVALPAFFDSLRARIDPPPAAGQSVAIEGDFCPVDFNCPPASIHFTASAPDNTPPQAPSAISFDVYDYPDFKSGGGDCQSDSDLGFWVTVDGAPAAAGEAPVIYSVKAYHRTETNFEEFGTSTLVSSETTRIGFHERVSVLHDDPTAEALCFRVTAIDSAGNAATDTIEACEPCHVRVDRDTGMPFPSTSEPEWSAADIYAGGSCDPSGGGGNGGNGGNGGGGAGPDRGEETVVVGGCTAAPPAGEKSSAPTTLLVFTATALLGASRLFRRRR